MSDSLLDDRLSTADIANPTPRQARAAARADRTDESDNQPIPLPATTPTESRAASSTTSNGSNGYDSAAPLFPDDELHNFRARWDQVQTSFVDEPRKAVEQADNLVASVVKRIAEQFSAERDKMEHRWDQGDNVNTEDLRQIFRSYRSFFDRLLSF